MIENLGGEKILITGGTGFLGRCVVERLVAENLTPMILSRNAEAKLIRESVADLDFTQLDLCDFSALKEFLEDFRPSIIIHLAGQVANSNNHSDDLYQLNYAATARLLDLAVMLEVKRLVMTGTADEYGFQNCPQVETMPTMPGSDYAVSKNKAVEYALSLHQTKDLPVVILRPFTIYGVGQPPKMFVAQAVEAAVNDAPFEMSEGLQKRDLLFVTDFVNAIIKTLTTVGIEGEIFNVGSGCSIALQKVAKKIWKLAEADAELLKIGARQTDRRELHDTQADISKIRNRLNWKPQVSLDDGLKMIVEQAKKELR
jgi:nucleoside-diphosphate-sugar epimerase